MMQEEIKNLPELLSQHVGTNKKVISSTVSKLTAPGENYLSVVLRVDVVLKNEDDGHEEKLSAVGKCLHSGDVNEMFKMIGKMNYNYEKAWYAEIVPTLQSFLKERGFEGNFDIFPKLIAYRANLQGDEGEVDGDSILLMENLNEEGKDANEF